MRKTSQQTDVQEHPSIAQGLARAASVKKAFENIDFAAYFDRYFGQAKDFVNERPGTALGIAFGAGMIFGGSIVNRVVRLAAFGALGAGINAILRNSPEWIEAAADEKPAS